jgi:hypothetical protein
MYRTGATSFAYIPLSVVSPKDAPSLIGSVAKKIADSKRDGTLPPGLAEQLDVQLDILRNDALPDLEVVVFPGHMVAPSKCDDKAATDTSDMCAKVLRSQVKVT